MCLLILKNQTLAKPFIEFAFFKICFFLFFVQKMDPSTLRLICIEELSKLKRTLGSARLLKSADFIKFKQR